MKSPSQGSRFPFSHPMQRIRLSFTLAASAYLLLGVVMLLFPDTSRKLLSVLTGAGMAVFGLMSVSSYFLAKGERQLTFDLLIGALFAAFGLFSLLNPSLLIHFLFAGIGMMILLTGAATLRRAWALRHHGFARWQAPFLCAALCMAFALSFILFPGFYGDMLMMAIGLALIVSAVDDLSTLYLLFRYKPDES